ncbi:MAG: shikimate kinase [Endomicrobia bacterium]|nr:shikimate kinase [Endomicrobiia bacterium]
MNLVLTGFMGSGKSTVGKIIAEKLGREYCDTDELIEKTAGMQINDIFKERGEAAFRLLESEIVKSVCEKSSAVISCGGGVVLNSQNIENLSKNGVIVYLYASPEQIYERIKNEGHRPLLKCADPLNEIKRLLEQRREAYSNCDFSFDTGGLSAGEAAEKILENNEIMKLIGKTKNN